MRVTSNRSGFTLLELMVAIAVFAVLGIMSAQLLNNMIRQHDIINERGDRLTGLQRAVGIMQRDVSQIVSRQVRSQYGDDRLRSVLTDADYSVEFTRTGWSNPLEHQRSNLQRVAYEHRDETLYRYYWSVLDRAIDTEPVEQVLLEDVLAVEFEALDGYAEPFIQGNADANPTDPRLQLAGLSVRFELEGYGEISRIWEVPSSLDRDPGEAAAGTGAPDEEDESESEEDNSDADAGVNGQPANPDQAQPVAPTRPTGASQ